jgi:uncharacterized protein YheU (UPF0270 family)
MTEYVITEFAGAPGGRVRRTYRYGSGGVRVLNAKNIVSRLYRFDTASDIITENDPARPDKVLRRLVFDRQGALEETFSFGQPPRTYRYGGGGSEIVMREGGDYGAVSKSFTFEGKGISETAFGRNGEIERVFVFEPDNETVTERTGGWYGDIRRSLVFEGITTSVFLEPEAFLQFLMFTERSAAEDEEDARREILGETGRSSRGFKPAPPRSRYAFTGKRPESSVSSRDSKGNSIDVIPDGDNDHPEAEEKKPPVRRSSDISFAERSGRRQ